MPESLVPSATSFFLSYLLFGGFTAVCFYLYFQLYFYFLHIQGEVLKSLKDQPDYQDCLDEWEIEVDDWTGRYEIALSYPLYFFLLNPAHTWVPILKSIPVMWRGKKLFWIYWKCCR